MVTFGRRDGRDGRDGRDDDVIGLSVLGVILFKTMNPLCDCFILFCYFIVFYFILLFYFVVLFCYFIVFLEPRCMMIII